MLRIIFATWSITSFLLLRNGSVNQRSSVGWTSGSMPCVSAVLMRSCHRGLASAGTRLDVSQRERLAKTSGALSASVWPIIPPMDSPTQWRARDPERLEQREGVIRELVQRVCGARRVGQS